MSYTISNYISTLRDKNIHVVGISGTEGSEIALFLAKHNITGFHVHDFSLQEEIKKHFTLSHSGLNKEEREAKWEELNNIEATFHYKDTYLEGIEDADIIFVPQSFYLYEPNEKLLSLEKEKQFINLTKLYFLLFPGKILAVTGSNGKTTTTNIIAAIFETAKKHKQLEGNYYFAGNDRRMNQMLGDIEEAKKEDWLILEVSNRQLRLNLERAPDIGVVTNITPTHLHEYTSWDEYKSAKESLFSNADENTAAILNYDDKESANLISNGPYQVFGFSLDKDLHLGAYNHNHHLHIKHGEKEEKICEWEELKLKGKHNIANILAASMASYIANIPIPTIKEAITDFQGVPQRMELIASHNGRHWYNDTASTAPESVIAALNTLSDKHILIMGGKTRGGEYEKLIELIPEKVSHLILLESPLSETLKEQLKDKVEIIEQSLLKQAVDQAYQKSTQGQSIIFSPGGEYFSYFQDKMPGYKNYRTFVERISEK